MNPETTMNIYPLSPHQEGFNYGLRNGQVYGIEIDPVLAHRQDFQEGFAEAQAFSSMIKKTAEITLDTGDMTEDEALASLTRQMMGRRQEQTV